MWRSSNYLDAVVKYMLSCLHFCIDWKFMYLIFCFQNNVVDQDRAYSPFILTFNLALG